MAAVVLAAGASTRYGGVKQHDLLPAVLAALRESMVEDVTVVEGAHPLEVSGVRVVRCADWEHGPGASLRCGLESLGPDVDRAIVLLADGPSLDPRAVDRLATDVAPFAAATYDGVTRSHPVAIDRALWASVPDEGGRAVQPGLVDCTDLQSPGDVDVRE
ncbi:MAG TPA: NTP transferase domain-containing protein [Gaiellaceae bacterium]|nr:NTP transferase domain-containing protein [Gaiellaceae bacterium]